MRPRPGRLAAITGGGPAYPLIVLFGLNLVNQLDQTAFGVLAPNIRDAFGLDLAGVLTLVTLIVPLQIFVGLPVSYYADRLNRIRIAVTGACIWALFSVATGLSVNVE